MSKGDRCTRCGASLSSPEGGSAVCLACLMRHGLPDTEHDATVAGTSLDPHEPEVPGDPDHVGPYRILRRLGEGGMGVVYLARQSGEIDRLVAVKVVKLGTNSKQVLARFQLERQSLALMQHPGIARIYDAGTTDDGQPYFVMEYVEGSPITTYCDDRRMPTAARVDLLREVCQAVQHAHQRGLIHRDLKPSNILVENTDDGPRAKVIDFGVAKATEKRFLEWSVFTEVGRLIGTPEYMSPEQAGDADREVDTRTDVYSLGVVLYELLVGVTPLRSAELRDAGLQALLKTIREASFPTPSSRYETLDEVRSDTAEKRRTDQAGLARELRGELDWIVMRALEREKDDRYGSPSELADELGRYLADEAVEAGPPSVAYRVRKFTRRHRVAVFSSVGALLLLIAGLAVTTSLWTVASRERDRADAGYAEVLRLADMKRLSDYEKDAETLWPAHPDRIADMRAWLRDKAEPLAARLELHRATLEELRDRAAPYDEAQRLEDMRTHPRAQELVDAREYLDERYRFLATARTFPDVADREDLIAHRENQIERTKEWIAEVEAAIATRRTWRFDDDETLWQHDMLTELVERLETFTDPDPFVGTMASVRDRLTFAEAITERSVTGPEVAVAWQMAIEDVAVDPRFDGLRLRPQVGLVPLGRNTATGLWEFWHIESGARPEPDPDSESPSPWRMTGDNGIVFVLVPGGTFWMGAQNSDPFGRNYDPMAIRREAKIMEVALAPFFLSKYEVNQGQWLRWTGHNPSRHPAGGSFAGRETTAAHPVEMVTWDDAMKVVARRGLLLPTEAQWEFAARAGTTTPWWTGARRESLRGAVNLMDRYLRDHGGWVDETYEDWLDDGSALHAPVGSYRANPLGLHDMLGNVQEWCREHYRSPYQPNAAPGDGYRKAPGGTGSRIVRGGAWNRGLMMARASNRGNSSPDTVDPALGLRVSRAIDP